MNMKFLLKVKVICVIIVIKNHNSKAGDDNVIL
jgi:hypothetical protein